MTEELCEYCECELIDHNYEHLSKYCYPIQIKRLRELVKMKDEALEKIASRDWRGNKPESISIAESALKLK